MQQVFERHAVGETGPTHQFRPGSFMICLFISLGVVAEAVSAEVLTVLSTGDGLHPQLLATKANSLGVVVEAASAEVLTDPNIGDG